MISRSVHFLRRYRKLTITMVAVITVLSLFLISKGTFSNSILDMLPLKDRVIAQHFRVLSLSGAMDRILFEMAIEDSSKTFDLLAEETREVITLLKKEGRVIFGDEITAQDFFELRNLIIRRWPDLFTREDSLWVSQRLGEDSLMTRFEQTVSGLFTFSDAGSDPFILQHDPFGLGSFALAKLAAFKPAEDITIEEGLITNNAHDRILFFAKAVEFGMRDAHARDVEQSIEAAQAHAAKNGFRLSWMGALRAARDNNSVIRRDINRTLPIAVILICIICFSIYRRLLFGFLTFIPTVLGICITLALFSCFTQLSIIIIGFGAALLGITVDYAIHYLYQVDDVPQDSDPVQTLTRPILASAFTTAGAFLVLIVAGIPGLAQLGIVTAVGIVIVALLSLTVLPVFAGVSTAKTSARPRVSPARLFEHFYEKKLDRKLVLPLVLVTAGACFFIPRLSFDGDPDNLNGMKPETIAAEESLSTNWSGIQSGTFLVVSDTSFDGVCLKAEQKVKPLVDSLTLLEMIKPTALFTLLLPPEETQKQNRIRWDKVFTPQKSAGMRKAVREVCAKYNLEPSRFEQYCDEIVSRDSTAFLTVKDFPESFRKGILKNYLFNDDSLWYANVPVFPTSDSVWNRIDKMARHRGVLAVNDDILGLRVVDIIKTGFFKCVIYIPLVTACILFIMLGNIRYVFLTLIPVVCATAITLGIMALGNIPVNIISLMIFAFLFGLGIDYAVLMVYMGRKSMAEGKNYIPHGAASVTVAACTTLAGLGVLAIAQHPVLTVLGRTGLVGILSSYICAVIFIPALFNLKFTEDGGGAPGSQ